MQKFWKILSSFPYALALVVGAALFVLSTVLQDPWHDLLLNVSASLITIPIVIFTYEMVQTKIAKEHNREVSDYTKMNVDREILAMIGKIMPLVFDLAIGLREDKLAKFLSLDARGLNKAVGSHTFLAFHLATDWKYTEDQFSDLLTNGVIYNNLSVGERSILIRFIKMTRSLEQATDPKFFIVKGKPTEKYKVVESDAIDPSSKYENRYLLLRKTKKSSQFVVAGFNDINKGKYQIDLLTPMRANNNGKELLVACCLDIMQCVSDWLDSRGDEFVIDSRNMCVHGSKNKRQSAKS